jgi:hypothetical protein
MWSDASWHHATLGLKLLELRVAALRVEMDKQGREGIWPSEVHARMFAAEGSVADALDLVRDSVAWELE